MNGPVDRDLVEQYLADQSLSYREIGRRAGCSDWTVRRIARDLAGEPQTPRRTHRESNTHLPEASNDTPPLVGWVVLLLFVVVIALAFFRARGDQS